jgi:hypothetical protein
MKSARVLVRFEHVASRIVNTSHGYFSIVAQGHRIRRGIEPCGFYRF